MRKLGQLLAALVVLLAVTSARPAAAQYPVADVGNAPLHILNTAQTYVTMLKEIYAVYQRGLQIYQQYQLILAEYRQLKSWVHDGEWHDMVGMYGGLESLMNQADRLGYQTKDLSILLDETYPGFQLPTTTSWLDDYHRRLRRGQTTTKEMLNVLDHISRMNVRSQIRLDMAQQRVGNSDGVVQAVQANSIIQSLAAEDLGRVVQASLTAANIDGIANAHKLQARMSDAALLEAWLQQTPLPINTQSFTGVPANWAW
ncbi:MAG: hypothetical protein ABI609_01125 [Acidobacteriota bacterium]